MHISTVRAFGVTAHQLFLLTDRVSKIKEISDVCLVLAILKQDNNAYISMKRLLKLEIYLYEKLKELNIIDNYTIKFIPSYDSMEWMVLYNNRLFDIDLNGQVIYLKDQKAFEEINWQIDDTVQKIVKDFCRL